MQRARKIFDPADHDVPSRIIKKCRTSSPDPTPDPVRGPRDTEKPGSRANSPKLGTEATGRLGSKPALPSYQKPIAQRTVVSSPKLTPPSQKSALPANKPTNSTLKPTVPPPKPTPAPKLHTEQSPAPSQPTYPDQAKKHGSARKVSAETGGNPVFKEKTINISDKAEKRKEDAESCDTTKNVSREELGAKKKIENGISQNRRQSDTAVDLKNIPRRKSEEKVIIRKPSALTPPRVDKKHVTSTETSTVIRPEKMTSTQPLKPDKHIHPDAKHVGPKKCATPAVGKSTSPNPTVSKTKNDTVMKENIDNSSKTGTENITLDDTETSKNVKKRAETVDPTFKVPAPKKPLHKVSAFEKQNSTKNGLSKSKGSKAAKQTSPKKGIGKLPKSPKSFGRSTRASSQTLTVSLRAKKDPKERGLCMICNTGNKKNEKLIFCKDCDKICKYSGI